MDPGGTATATLDPAAATVIPFDLRTRELALLLGLLHALPTFGINYLQEVKCWFGVGGAARKALQVAFIRQSLGHTSDGS